MESSRVESSRVDLGFTGEVESVKKCRLPAGRGTQSRTKMRAARSRGSFADDPANRRRLSPRGKSGEFTIRAYYPAPPLTIPIAKVYNVIRPSSTYSNINMDKRALGFARSANSLSVLIPSLIQSACNCQRDYATVEALDFN